MRVVRRIAAGVGKPTEPNLMLVLERLRLSIDFRGSRFCPHLACLIKPTQL